MDEFNLASRFAPEEDEAPRRGRIKRLRPGKTGVGMEKPVGHGKVIGEGSADVERSERVNPADFGGEDFIASEDSLDLDSVEVGEDDEGHPMFENRNRGVPHKDMPEEDDAFRDLVERMEGESASAGRASARRAKMKNRRPAPRRFEDEEE